MLLQLKRVLINGLFLVLCALKMNAQRDTIVPKSLDSVRVSSYLNQIGQYTLPSVQGSFIFLGKKSELINVTLVPTALADKTGRQLFAKVPGVFVYDMDGAGNQVNIAARGLDPHRGWDFNIRKDGVLTNSDMYGYPASHFSMPLESIDKIELVRGTGSLQYGAQFGGMLNYVSKVGDTSRPFGFESINTVGSFNLLSSYNAIGGKVGKFRYYAYIQKKSREGYRDNEQTRSDAQGVTLVYEVNSRFSVQADWARSVYVYRMAGQLTDQQFRENPRQASRLRNYYSPDIHVPSLTLKWQLTPSTKMQLIASAVIGSRNSVMFDKPASIRDTINASTMQYNNRQVDIDRFNSYTVEWRLLQQYRVGNQESSLAAGIQYMNNDLHRRQLGKGTTGSDFDLSLLDPNWGRNLHFRTKNIAFFAENLFQITSKFSATAGIRVESGATNMTGKIVYYPENQIPVSISHRFPLLAAGLSFKPVRNMELYGGWSQSYRPMLFKDLIPASLLEKVDPAIKDGKGYNAELGFKGNWKFLRWDLTGFLLQFNHRFGNTAQTDNAGNFYTYRTNIGNSLTKGLEIFVQADWILKEKIVLTVFNSTAFIDARYKNAAIKSGNSNISIDGNKVESAPSVITRSGATLKVNRFSAGLLYSYTASSYADPLNTVVPPAATGAVGLVPAYGLLDLNFSFRVNNSIDLKLNANNLTNKQYFTKRPLLYPGPGIWPSDGRSMNFTVGIEL